MSDNGSHVEFLPGARAGVVRVYGDHRVGVERTMKHVMLLVRPVSIQGQTYTDCRTSLRS